MERAEHESPQQGESQSDGVTTRSIEPIRIGVSTCLLGEHVRFDGGHRRDSFLVETLGRYVEWVPVCPEVEAGLGVPRESMHLRRIEKEVRLVTTETGIDHTDAIRRYAARRVTRLREYALSGYVLKSNSPSCGMERVKIYGRSDSVANGRGLFAEALLQAFPQLPVEEEARLRDPRVRENFIERVFACRRLLSLFSGRWTIGHLVAFHSAHKLQLMAHSPRLYAELGRLVAGAKSVARRTLRVSYETQFMSALEVMATTRRNVNALEHILGYFSDRLDRRVRREVVALIEDYGSGTSPLIVPLTLLRVYVRRFEISYLQTQTFLDPYPKELMLRNPV